MDAENLIETLRSQENLDRNEGERGVKNLCRFVNIMGYKDDMYFGQFLVGKQTACYGDLIAFLEDNSGAVEAIYKWIAEGLDSEQQENLLNELTPDNREIFEDEDEGYGIT